MRRRRYTRVVCAGISLLLAAGLLPERLGAEASCPAQTAGDDLHKNMDVVRGAMAQRFGSGWTIASLPAQLAEEMDRLQKGEREVTSEGRALKERWDDCETQAKQLDFDHRDFDSRLKFIDRSEENIKPREENLEGRLRAIMAERDRHNMAMPAQDDKAAMARWNAEADDGNRRIEELKKEQAALEAEHQAITDKRNAMFAEVSELAAKSNVLMRRKQVLMGDLAPFMVKARRLSIDAVAFAQIPASGVTVARPAPENHYENYDKIGKEMLGTMAQEASLQVLKRAVIASEGPGIAVAGADLVRDAGGAGVDARTQEVERNILLIGDYGRVLKRMKEGGTLKADDPTYQAIRQVLEERKEAMPSSTGEIMLEGLESSEALTAAISKKIVETAGGYVAGKASRAGAEVVKHLSNTERAVLGKSMVKFFEHCLSGTAEVGAQQTVETTLTHGSKMVAEQLYGPPKPGGANE